MIMNRIRKRKAQNQESGDGIFVMSVIFTMFFALVMGFAIDISKAVYVKGSHVNLAQEAASEAVRKVGVTGSLSSPDNPLEDGTNSVSAFIDYYNLGFTNNGTGGEIQALSRRGRCTTVDVPGVGETAAPYIEIQLYSKRGSKYDPEIERTGYYWKPGMDSSNPGEGLPSSDPTAPAYNSSATYRVISAKVWDTSPNVMLGIFGLDCQQTLADVNSITFGSQEDVDNWEGEGSEGGDDEPIDPNAAPQCPGVHLQESFWESGDGPKPFNWQWDGQTNINRYVINYREISGDTEKVIQFAGGGSIDLRDAFDGVPWYKLEKIMVRAENDAGISEGCSWTHLPQPLGKDFCPTDLKITKREIQPGDYFVGNPTRFKITLSWSHPVSVTGQLSVTVLSGFHQAGVPTPIPATGVFDLNADGGSVTIAQPIPPAAIQGYSDAISIKSHGITRNAPTIDVSCSG